MISICFPHILNEENNRVLSLNLQMIEENTTCPFEVLFLANMKRPDLVYSGWNFLMQNAKYELVAWMNSDILLSPNWNENVIKHKDDADWIGIENVEPGAIGVADSNIHKDFGLTAASFRRQEFETWSKEFTKDRPSMREGFAWYSPSVFKRTWFIEMGMFPTEKPFPYPNDIDFKNKVTKLGCRFIVANSTAYHLQRGHIHQGLQPERV